MRKLESMIAEFVGGLLQTIGDATVDELRDLFAAPPAGATLLEAPPLHSTPIVFGPSSRGAPPARVAGREGRGKAAAPRRSFGSRSSISSGPSLPPGVAEITDPESLLSLGGSSGAFASNGAAFSHGANGSAGGSAPDAAATSPVEPTRIPSRARARALLEVAEVAEVRVRATHTDVHPEPEGESPASGVRPVGSGSTVKLSDNETLARVSNSGVVIRRKKRA
jgi:hypothetical protein